MPLQTLVWLLVLGVLLVLGILVLRRISALVARTRDLERYQKALTSLDERSAAVIDPLVRELDGARRQHLDPTGLRNAVTAAQGTIADLALEARALPTPAPLVSTTVSITA